MFAKLDSSPSAGRISESLEEFHWNYNSGSLNRTCGRATSSPSDISATAIIVHQQFVEPETSHCLIHDCQRLKCCINRQNLTLTVL